MTGATLADAEAAVAPRADVLVDDHDREAEAHRAARQLRRPGLGLRPLLGELGSGTAGNDDDRDG